MLDVVSNPALTAGPATESPQLALELRKDIRDYVVCFAVGSFFLLSIYLIGLAPAPRRNLITNSRLTAFRRSRRLASPLVTTSPSPTSLNLVKLCPFIG